VNADTVTAIDRWFGGPQGEATTKEQRAVKDRIDKMLKYLRGTITIECECYCPPKDGIYPYAKSNCKFGWTIFICPHYWTLNDNSKEFVLMHETVHLTGVCDDHGLDTTIPLDKNTTPVYANNWQGTRDELTNNPDTIAGFVTQTYKLE
jgi:hypothetical protein